MLISGSSEYLVRVDELKIELIHCHLIPNQSPKYDSKKPRGADFALLSGDGLSVKNIENMLKVIKGLIRTRCFIFKHKFPIFFVLQLSSTSKFQFSIRLRCPIQGKNNI